MKRADGDLEMLVAAARQFAAMQDSFAPEAALERTLGARAVREPVLAARVLSALRLDCTIEAGPAGERWLMRPAARRKVLDTAAAEALAGSAADTPVADALAGRGDFAPEALERMVTGVAGAGAMEAVAVALDRAGPAAPGFEKLVRIRSALNTRRAEARTDARLAAGFFGRETQLARLAAWIDSAQTDPPVRTVHVSGLPGIGKSFLLERVIQMARSGPQPILIALDFDRSGLNVLDAHAFIEEISRQLADALPEAAATLRDLRLRSAEQRATETGTSASYSLPRELLAAMGRAVGASGRRVLVVLDTLEVLRRRGETQVMTLFDRLDTLLRSGIAPLAVISAGRGDALDPVPNRVEDRVRLDGLEEGAARLLLEAKGVPPALWPRILPLARGNPLLLTLAAKAFDDAGYDAADIPAGAGEETIGGYLYRAVLSRVPERLRRIANEGLILRSIDAERLTGIVAPALGLSLAEDEARRALGDLAAHHWLVEPEPGGGLRHREDIRRAFLPLLYAGPADTRAAAEAINLAAAVWFAARDPVEALYHRLQATRFGHPMPELPVDLARALAEPVIEELPPAARDALLQAQGRRSGFARAEVPDDASGEEVQPGGGGDRASASAQQPIAEPGAPGNAFADRDGRRLDKAAGAEVGFRTTPQAQPAQGPPRRGAAGASGGGRSGGAAPDPRALRDLELTLERGDLREAGHVYRAASGRTGMPSGPSARPVLSYLWLSGHWSAALRLARAQPALTGPEVLAESPHLHGRVALEIAAEADFGGLVRRLRDDDEGFALARTAHDASQRVGMVAGALDFAFLASGRPDEQMPRRLELARSLLAAAHPQTPAAEAAPALDAADAARRAFGLFHEPLAAGGPDVRHPAVRAELVQALNPYGAALHALVSDEPEGRVAAYLEGLRPRLPEAAALFRPDLRGAEALPGRLVAGAADVAAALTALGLAADWSSVHVIGRSRADLRLIAAAAERWRRRVSGLWSHGRLHPAGWPADGGSDRLAARCLTRIVEALDPVGAAWRELGFWRAADDPGVRRRFAAWTAAAGVAAGQVAGRPGASLEALLAAGAPGAVAVPLAVLMAQGLAPVGADSHSKVNQG